MGNTPCGKCGMLKGEKRDGLYFDLCDACYSEAQGGLPKPTTFKRIADSIMKRGAS